MLSLQLLLLLPRMPFQRRRMVLLLMPFLQQGLRRRRYFAARAALTDGSLIALCPIQSQSREPMQVPTNPEQGSSNHSENCEEDFHRIPSQSGFSSVRTYLLPSQKLIVIELPVTETSEQLSSMKLRCRLSDAQILTYPLPRSTKSISADLFHLRTSLLSLLSQFCCRVDVFFAELGDL